MDCIPRQAPALGEPGRCRGGAAVIGKLYAVSVEVFQWHGKWSRVALSPGVFLSAIPKGWVFSRRPEGTDNQTISHNYQFCGRLPGDPANRPSGTALKKPPMLSADPAPPLHYPTTPLPTRARYRAQQPAIISAAASAARIAGVAVGAAGAVDGLLLRCWVVRTPKMTGRHSSSATRWMPRAASPANIVEVRRIAAHHASQADDRREAMRCAPSPWPPPQTRRRREPGRLRRARRRCQRPPVAAGSRQAIRQRYGH